LALNQGYGWAGDVNLRLIFDNLFTPETGNGYPPHRAEPQRQGRELLAQVSQVTHRSLAEILLSLPENVVRPALTFTAFRPVLEEFAAADADIHSALMTF
jgi:hypothetical protein